MQRPLKRPLDRTKVIQAAARPAFFSQAQVDGMIPGTVDSWERRIDRARLLADEDVETRPLLLAYAEILCVQRECFDAFFRSAARLTAALDRDLAWIVPGVPPLFRKIAATGPFPVAEQAERVLDAGEPAIEDLLRSGWRQPVADTFLSRVVLQPYAECLAVLGRPPVDRGLPVAVPNACPFCGGAAQLSVLQTRGEGDAGGRQLLCSICSTRWNYGRLRCAFCGEEDERRLPYYRAPRFDHVRLDVCETCGHYVKTVDLTRLGTAVPVVDEVASAAMDLWARAQGYEKVALNLIGL